MTLAALTLCPNKSKISTPNSWRYLFQFLTDFQSSFTAGKRSKFSTKSILYFPTHLQYAVALLC